jgi:hypothetical protein
MCVLTRGAAFWSAVLLVVGCSHGLVAASPARLEMRARHDLDCPVARLKTREIDDRAFAVGGCGLEAIYVHQCDQLANCDWVLDSRRQLQAPP